MPTGYTAAVADGTLTDFRKFAARCAHAFGANILVRDDGMDAPIPVYEPSDYYQKAAERTRARLYDLERMTVEDAARKMAADEAQRVMYEAECEARRKSELARYETMLKQVDAWVPPTPDHLGLKDFMRQQLRESIRYDCSPPAACEPRRETPAEFLQREIAQAAEAIDSYDAQHAEEVRRTRERNEWNRALFESLAALGAK